MDAGCWMLDGRCRMQARSKPRMQLSAAKRKYKTLNSTAGATIPCICPPKPARSSLPCDTFNCTLDPRNWQQFDGTAVVGRGSLSLWAGPTNPDTASHPLAGNLGHFLAANNSEPEVQKIWPKNNIYVCAVHWR